MSGSKFMVKQRSDARSEVDALAEMRVHREFDEQSWQDANTKTKRERCISVRKDVKH